MFELIYVIYTQAMSEGRIFCVPAPVLGCYLPGKVICLPDPKIQ